MILLLTTGKSFSISNTTSIPMPGLNISLMFSLSSDCFFEALCIDFIKTEEGNNGSNVYGVYSLAANGSNNNYAGYFSGNIGYTGSLIHISDLKFKEDLIPLKGSLSKLMKLNTYSYSYKTLNERFIGNS